MLTVHPTLLIGPSDWQPERMPQDEFVRRIESLWQAFPNAARAIVYGTPRHHAELAYFTNLVPKLEAAVALLSRNGVPKLVLGGGPNMLGAAKPLTWITDLTPLRGGQAIGQMAIEGGRADNVIVIGGGAMPTAFRQSMNEAMGGEARDATAQVWCQMRRTTSYEQAAIGEACGALRAAMAAIAQAKRTGLTAAVLAGERAANQAGAQDVRILFSRNGGRTLEPFVELIEQAVDPLQVYVAVRRCNYWAEGFAPFAEQPHPAKAKAMTVLARALDAIKAGAWTPDIVNLITSAIHPDLPHPVTERACAQAIGIGLDEAPYTDVGPTFEADTIYSLKVGIRTGAGSNAIVSAMIAVQPDGNDVLWITP